MFIFLIFRNTLSVPLIVVTIFFRSIYDKTIIRFGFFDIQKNQGLGEGYYMKDSASADTPHLDLDYSDYQ